jgi:lambda family phage minor tail protein L
MPTTPEQRARWLNPDFTPDQAVVRLYELDLSSINSAYTGAAGPVVCFHDNPDGGTVIFDGTSYDPWPINADSFEINMRGPFPRPKLSVSNIGSVVSSLLREYADCVGAILTVRQTFKAYLTQPAGSEPANKQFTPLIFVVERKTAETNTVCSFDLASPMDAEGILLPRRQVLATACPWRYRSTECSFGAPAEGWDGWPVANRLGEAFGPSISGTIQTNPNDNDALTKLYSATANFVSSGLRDDTNKIVTCPYFDKGTRIAEVYDSQNVRIEPAAYSAGVIPSITINRLIGRAANGTESLPLEWAAGTPYQQYDVAYMVVKDLVRIYAVSKGSNTNKSIYNENYWMLDYCLKKQADCEWHFNPINQLPYGGFPGANKLQ